MLKNFFFKRPNWFRHEGYWRLAQVLRVGPSIFFLLIALLCLAVIPFIADDARDVRDRLEISLGFFAASVASFVIAHWLIRLVAWIADGFKEAGKS